MAKALDISGKGLFVLGFLWVCCVGTAPDMPLHILGLTLCGTGAVALAVSAVLAGRQTPGAALPGLLLALAGYIAVRAIVSPVRHLAEMDVFLVAALVCGFSAAWFSGQVRWIEPWIWMVAIGGTGIGLWQVFVDKQFTILRVIGLIRPVDTDRASGFFYNPNPFGAWCAMLMALAGASMFCKRRSVLRTCFSGVAAVAAIVGLLLSYARGAFLAGAMGFSSVVLVSLAVVFGLRSEWWKKALVSLIVLGLALAGVMGTARWLPKLVEKRSAKGDVSQMMDPAGRIPYWHMGMSQFIEAPLLGGGGRSYSYCSYEHWDKKLQVFDLDPVYAHSEYVQALADYGFVGLVLVLSFSCGGIGMAAVRSMEVGREEKSQSRDAKLAWCLGSIGAGVAFLTDACFSFSGHFAPMLLLLGTMAGGVAAVGRKGEEHLLKGKRQKIGATGWMVFAAVVASTCYLWLPGFAVGWTSCQMHVVKAIYDRGMMQPSDFLSMARRWAQMSPRYPNFILVGKFSKEFADCSPTGSQERRKLNEESLEWVNHAVAAFPMSVEGLLLRAQVKDNLGFSVAADEDFHQASELSKAREYIYRVNMHHGEAVFQRAMDEWRNGNIHLACRLMERSRQLYSESNKRAWIGPREARWKDSAHNLEENISFFKRTGIWVDE